MTIIKELTRKSTKTKRRAKILDLLYFYNHYVCDRKDCGHKWYSSKDTPSPIRCSKCHNHSFHEIPSEEVDLKIYDKHLRNWEY